MEKDINTEVSNTQLPATEEKANLKESLRIQKSQWIKEQIKRQREAEDAVLEQMIEEQRVIDGLNSDINENLDRTRESRKFNQEFQEKINTQIYEMNGITEDKLKGMREYKNAYYQGCAFSLFLLSVVMIGICGVLHGFESQICLFMIACTGADDVVDAHGHAVDADGVVLVHQLGQAELGAHAVGAGDQHRLLHPGNGQAEAAAEAAHVVQTA